MVCSSSQWGSNPRSEPALAARTLGMQGPSPTSILGPHRTCVNAALLEGGTVGAIIPKSRLDFSASFKGSAPANHLSNGNKERFTCIVHFAVIVECSKLAGRAHKPRNRILSEMVGIHTMWILHKHAFRMYPQRVLNVKMPKQSFVCMFDMSVTPVRKDKLPHKRYRCQVPVIFSG